MQPMMPNRRRPKYGSKSNREALNKILASLTLAMSSSRTEAHLTLALAQTTGASCVHREHMEHLPLSQ